MKLDIFLNKSANLTAENRLLKLFMLVIGSLVLINTVSLYLISKNSRTILVPPSLSAKVEIAGDRASDAYIREFTRYAAGLVLNYTPATARAQFEEALTLYAPESYPEGRAMLYDLAETIEQTNTTNAFFIQKIEIDDKGSIIELAGLTRQFIRDKQTEFKGASYLIRYRIENARFMITEFLLKPKD